jgi:uncharacterized membrane protein
MTAMLSLFWLILLTFILGPLGSVPYALAQGLSMVETAIVLSVVHAALVPVWFVILELIRYRLIYENRLVNKIVTRAWTRSKRIRSGVETNMREFERRVGQKGFGIGVILFTFTFGISWAVLSAVLLNIKKNTIIVSIAIGAVLSSVFTSLVLGGMSNLLPSPWLLYLIGLFAIAFVFGYQKYRERKVLREISKKAKK